MKQFIFLIFVKKVYLIYRKDKLRADNTLVERLNTKENVEVLYNTIPVKVDGNDSVEKLITDKGELSVKGCCSCRI
mgnify:CR=1 FL=1